MMIQWIWMVSLFYVAAGWSQVECKPIDLKSVDKSDQVFSPKAIVDYQYDRSDRVQFSCTDQNSKQRYAGMLLGGSLNRIRQATYGVYDHETFKTIDLSDYDRPSDRVVVTFGSPTPWMQIPSVFDLGDLVPHDVQLGERNNPDRRNKVMDYTVDTNMAFIDFLRADPYRLEDPQDMLYAFRYAPYWPDTFTYHWEEPTKFPSELNSFLGDVSSGSGLYLQHEHLFVLDAFEASAIFFKDSDLKRKVTLVGEIPEHWHQVKITDKMCEKNESIRCKDMGDLIFPQGEGVLSQQLLWKPSKKSEISGLYLLDRESDYESSQSRIYWGPRFQMQDSASVGVRVVIDKEDPQKISVQFL